MAASSSDKTSQKGGGSSSNANTNNASSSIGGDSSSKTSDSRFKSLDLLLQSIAVVGLLQILYRFALEAYRIRLYAIEEYGRVIHEFDPYFNYRATEYLWKHGWQAFSHWYDTKVWYPLGRPVGTTIYPGMQVTAVAIKSYLLPNWSINDVCCFIPAWFGVAATLAVAWLTHNCVTHRQPYTCFVSDIPVVSTVYRKVVVPLIQVALKTVKQATGSDWGLSSLSMSSSHPLTPLCCAVAAASIMSIVPAHLLRSVGGGYDNESVAMTAMVLTFCCWTKSLQDTKANASSDKDKKESIQYHAILWGVLTGLAYFNMVAAWGGYVFVLNLVGLHAAFLVLVGRYSRKLYWAYTCFYIVGTALAIRVPVVGWTPLKSLEQIGPAAVFGGMQVIWISDYLIAKRKTKRVLERWKIRVTVGLMALFALALAVAILAPTGYFGPISSRVRGLFVKHTKTGNPLVDSVAEHQPASTQAYFQYLNTVCYLAPIGLGLVVLFGWSDPSSFLLVYGIAAYFFSHRMVRLILLTAPIASVCGGIFLGNVAGWMLGALTTTTNRFDFWGEVFGGRSSTGASAPSETTRRASATSSSSSDPLWVRLVRLAVSAYLIKEAIPHGKAFWDVSHEMAHHISHPSIIQKGRTPDGQMVTIDDYREAYFWLRDNTDEDARIMAWWDYGYQITGIAERTTIADGNTWNHEHIAFLGRTLTSPEKEAHRVARHLADYVLVWAGGGGDDLAKSPHLRRIANSVFRGLCKEPTCREFGFYSDRTPTPSMEESLLYKLVMNKIQPEVTIDPNRFREVFRSRYGKVRIYKVMSVSKESKEWVADPANRVCDAPGSWICRGQYPPALQKILKEKKDFKQLEDFNIKGEDDSEYQKQYMENLLKNQGHSAEEREIRKQMMKKKSPKRPSASDIDDLNTQWANNEATTVLWNLISNGQVEEIQRIFEESPVLPHIRSEDGRGPMWWAHEYGRTDIIELLKSHGVSEERKDKDGFTPLDITKA